MKRSALLVLSSLLLNTASYAGNTKCDDCYDLSTKHAAALHYTTSKPNSPETKYWDDYIYSGQKDITVYVRDLSRKDAQAALWFITTGGKYGFAAREATPQERTFLEDAIKNVAISYSQQGVKSGRGLQEWSQVSNANHAGHLHLQMIYKQIDSLKSEVNTLNLRVTLLEKAKEEGLAEIKLIRAEANQAKLDSDKKFTSLSDTLIADSNARKEEMKKLPALLAKNSQDIKAMMDKYEENWKTTLTAWTTNLDKERDEREKSRQERERLLSASEAERAVADAEKVRLTTLITQNQKNAEKKLADQQLADKTAADAEKAAYEKKLADQKKEAEDKEKKLKEDADRVLEAQKLKRRQYKKDLNDYKDQENKNKLEAAAKALKEKEEENKNKLDAKDEEVRKATEREKTAADALKLANEAAAKKDEGMRKEREEMAKEREALMKMLEAFQKGQISQPLGTGSQVDQEGNSSVPSTNAFASHKIQFTREWKAVEIAEETARNS